MTTINLPESLKVSVITKGIDYTDKKPQFKFFLKVSNGDKSMEVEYSGGVLAFFTPLVKPEKFKNDEELDAWHLQEDFLNWAKHDIMSRDSEVFEHALQILFDYAQPKKEDVFHSLVMDAQAGEETFEDFCANFGYDEDSRKAFKVWETCRDQGKEFRKLVGDLFEEIEEALQDY